MNYFWVNQGKTYNDESNGGYLWAPETYTKKDGTLETPHHWESMKLIEIGDVILNYNKKEGGIIGYCIAKSNYYEANKPEFTIDDPEEKWDNEGYKVDAEYVRFNKPIQLSLIYNEIRSFLPKKYSPIANKDRVNQGYLFQINEQLVSLILSKSKNELIKVKNTKVKKIQFISPSKFEQEYELFKDYLFQNTKIKFTSFSHPYIKEKEDYKKDIHNKALIKLNFKDWKKTSIGSGQILKSVINAIEIKGNNLLNWIGRYGEDSKTHSALIQASNNQENLPDLEKLFFGFFHSQIDDEKCFNQLIKYCGKKYALIAYLFYLKSDRKYVPIATSYFDTAFSKLGSNFKTSGKASWTNYMQFIELIKDTKSFIEDKLSHEIPLIDAHSFLWIVGTKKENNKSILTNEISVKFHKIKTTARVIQSKRKAGEITTESPVNHLEIAKKKQIKGREAEEFVFEQEKKKLIELNRPKLAEMVTNKSNQLGLGYDILSFNEDGSEKHIEVKSSNSNSFHISKNELEVSQKDPNFYIYIVQVNRQKTNYIIKEIKNPKFNNKDEFTLTPKEFIVSFKPIKD